MKRILALVVVLLLHQISLADYHRYSLGGGGSLVKLTGGDFYSFHRGESYDFAVGHRVGDRWLLSINYSFFTLHNNAAADSNASIGDISNNSAMQFKASRLGILANRLLFDPAHKINLSAGLGGGAMFWKMVDPTNNVTFRVPDDRDILTDFSATELFLTAAVGLVVSPVSRLSLNADIRADYLTHAGAEFAPEVKSSLDRWLLGAALSLTFRFGGADKPVVWVSDSSWNSRHSAPLARSALDRDGDGDGVADEIDRCLTTPRGAPIDRFGCALDSDNDGVADVFDDCPDTDPVARSQVDISGCPVDSDFDGIHDYLDACPHNQIAAHVDDTGCPVDSDGDGVPDGPDDCPYTIPGVDVDKHGCIDLTMLSQPMILNIDYPSGSFEIDPNSKERVKKLAGILNFVSGIRLEIHGYTDNIGSATANRRLALKRADRVRDYLVTLGVDSDRIKVFGRGEENFLASNQTKEGRAKNRRIEIVFYQ
jgi:OOP family OmpA-OmpF porin